MQIYHATSESFLVDSCVTFNARKGPAQEIVCFFLLNLVSNPSNVLSGTHCYDREQKRSFARILLAAAELLNVNFEFVTSQVRQYIYFSFI